MEKEINEVPEAMVLKRGTEVKARIISIRSGVSDKNNAQWYQPVFDVPSEPLAKEFNDFFWDLADLQKLENEKQRLGSLRKFKNFAASFGLDYSRPFDWEEDLVGLEGWLIVGVRKTDEYGDQNTVQKYLAGTSGRGAVEVQEEDTPF